MKNEFWKVAIIDDSLEDRAEIRRLLLKGSERRYEFIEAENGAAGVRECLASIPDCLVLDYFLPDMAAGEVLAALADAEGSTICPTVVVTGSDDLKLGRAVVRAGAQDFLGKSWMTVDSLTRAVENAAERWAMARELRARASALQLSRQQLQLAVEVAGLGVNRFDYAEDTVVLDAIAAELFGLEAGVALPRSAIHATFHPDDADEIFRHMDRSHDPKGDGSFVMDHRVVHRDGSIHWLSVKKQVIFADVGGIRIPVTGVLAAVDITARKQAQAEFRRVSTLLDTLLRTAPIGFCFLDCDLRYVRINDRLAAMNGVSAEAHLGRHVSEIVPSLMDSIREVTARILATGEAVLNHEFSGETPAAPGVKRVWSECWYLVRDGAGEVLGFGGIVEEITDRERTEAALRSSEIRYRRLFEAAKDGVLILDGQTGQITDANPYVLGVLGLTRGESLGRELWEIGVFADATASRAAMSELQTRGYIRYDDLPLESKSGQRREVEVVANAYPENGHRVIQCNIRDITERKAIEKELLRHREDLQLAVEERTAELATSTVALHTAERLAALGTLAAGLGHDIANMTMPVRARLRMLETACTTEEARTNLAAISKSLDHLSTLSAGMRLMAMDTGRLEASTPAADLEAWCEETFQILHAALPRHIRLECGVPAGLGVTIARHRLAQAVLNLVQNAGEAMADQPAGTVHITAEAATSPAGEPVIRLLVQDDGPGMPAEVMARCFEPYFSTKGRAIATGMGLGMVRGIVESAGGTVAVRSAPGEGTTFTMTLPAAVSGRTAVAGVLRTAAITIKGQREESLAMMFLEQLAFKTFRHLESSAPDVAVWVVETPDVSLLRAYLDKHPRGRMVVIEGELESSDKNGSGSSAEHAAGLDNGSERLTVLSPSPSPGALRDAITQACHASVQTATEK